MCASRSCGYHQQKVVFQQFLETRRTIGCTGVRISQDYSSLLFILHGKLKEKALKVITVVVEQVKLFCLHIYLPVAAVPCMLSKYNFYTCLYFTVLVHQKYKKLKYHIRFSMEKNQLTPCSTCGERGGGLELFKQMLITVSPLI